MNTSVVPTSGQSTGTVVVGYQGMPVLCPLVGMATEPGPTEPLIHHTQPASAGVHHTLAFTCRPVRLPQAARVDPHCIPDLSFSPPIWPGCSSAPRSGEQSYLVIGDAYRTAHTTSIDPDCRLRFVTEREVPELPRETARIIQLMDRVEDIYDATARRFLSDGVICAAEQPILDEMHGVLTELQEANVSRLASQELQNQWLRANPNVLTLVQGQAARNIREFRRDTSDAPEAA